MSRAVQITCDVCGKQKQQANHWFIVAWEITVNTDTSSKHPVNIVIAQEEINNWALHFKTADLCGESCVTKKISDLIGPPKC